MHTLDKSLYRGIMQYLLVSVILICWIVIYLAPVVQEVDNAIHRINLYPLDSTIGFPNIYPLDSNLSGG